MRWARDHGGRAAVVAPNAPRLAAALSGVAGADLLTALQRAGMTEDRISQVAALIERASMLDDVVAITGGAGVGAIITVEDRAGRTTEYELVDRMDSAPVREQVRLASATGKAPVGAR